MSGDIKQQLGVSRLSNTLLLTSSTSSKFSTTSLLARHTGHGGVAKTSHAPPTRLAHSTATKSTPLGTGSTTSSKPDGTGLSSQASLRGSGLSQTKQSLLLSKRSSLLSSPASRRKEKESRTDHDPQPSFLLSASSKSKVEPSSTVLRSSQGLQSAGLSTVRPSGSLSPSTLPLQTKHPPLLATCSSALISRLAPGLSTSKTSLTTLTTSHASTLLTSKLTATKLPSSKSSPQLTRPSSLATKSQLATRPASTTSPSAVAPPTSTSPALATSRDRDLAAGKGSRVLGSALSQREEPAVTAVLTRAVTEEVDAPSYDFSSGRPKAPVEQEPQFLPPELDATLQASPSPALDTTQMKTTLINAVAVSLLSSPDFHSSADPAHRHLKRLGEQLTRCDPEFLLKVALYTRCDLNIRTTANFLLGLAASLPNCRPYLKKYFNACVRLPSDWIELAEIYQTFHDRSINFGALPTALRKVMGAKFTEFDAYQLAKYNKDSSKKKKKKPKVEKKGTAEGEGGGVTEQPAYKMALLGVTETGSAAAAEGQAGGGDSSCSDGGSSEDSVVGDSNSESEEQLQQMSFTLKQLVRKIHISEPVEHVMCLVGKKYPEDPELFRRSRLPGTWDQERAGKRMKLATPETWETQVSLKGNRASTWEGLIDHNKLPFMAMLRNLRNLIIAGVSPKHHQWVIRKLNDERAVVNSKQFPFRFFSAYEVLGELEKIARGEAPAARARRPSKVSTRKPRKVKEPPKVDVKLLERYRTTLDNALKTATCYNVKPISGTTLILCNVGSNMERPCTAARGLGKPRTVLEVGVLLGLMCKYTCECSRLIVYGPGSFAEVQLQEGTILKNMDHVTSTAANEGLMLGEGEIPSRYLRNLLIDRVPMDNLVLLTDTMKVDDPEGRMVMNFLRKYRHLVNPNLLFVSVDLSSRMSGVSRTIKPEHKNDIYLAGYSDQILRFIAERGDSGQLVYVENIDKVYNLTPVKEPALLSQDSAYSLAPEKRLMAALQHQWQRTVRVFISSTFRDMHGERDLLTRFVFPELRARASTRQIQLYEVDLRWGVTEEATRGRKALEMCLCEVSRSQYFIGLLGERYGWAPDEYTVPDTVEYDWLKEYPPGRSVTELEMHHAALCDPEKVRGKAFFYFRDPSFLVHIPAVLKRDFESESCESKEKMENLKSSILHSGLEVYSGYSCHWLGEVQGKLMVGGLEDFGRRVLHNLWNAIQRDHPEDTGGEDPVAQATACHEVFAESQAHDFVGRCALLRQLHEAVEACDGGVVMVSGKPGSGKSALVAAYAQFYTESSACSSSLLVLPHFISAAPDSTNIASVLTRLCHELKRRFRVGFSVLDDFTELVKDFPRFLEESVSNVGGGSKILILIDGLDLLEEKHNARSMEWLPVTIPTGVVVVVSGVESGQCVSLLRRRKPAPVELTIGAMDIFDKGEMVRRCLSKYRKTLSESPFNNQMKLLLTKKEAASPLYLQLACEELHMFGVFEEVTPFLKRLPPTVANLLQDILLRLETEHGTELLSTSLTLLCLVQNGLLECELSGILTSFFGPGGGSQIQMSSLPTMVVSRLLRSLQTFLQPMANEQSDRLSLAHKDIEKVVRSRYMRGAASEREKHFHRLLANHFALEADPTGNKHFLGNSARAFTELPFHLMAAGAWKELEETLCNIHFVVAKCQHGLAAQLLQDYSPSVLNLPQGKAREVARFTQQPTVLTFKSFVSRNLHILSSNPTLVLQQAINEPSSSAMSRVAREVTQESHRSLVTWINKPEEETPCQLNISAHAGPASCVAVSQDGGLFAVGFKNCSVKLFETSTGSEVHSFIGHAAGVTSVCFVGLRALCSASHDKTLSLWDIKDGFRIATLTGHSQSVHGCLANPSGKEIASVSWDRTIKVWHGQGGKLLCTLKTPGLHNTPINCVGFHPEGQLIVVGGWDTSLKVWDIYNQKRLKTLKGHRTAVRACTYAPSGRHIVSAALDGEVKVWSTKSGSAVGSIHGHNSPVNSVAFTPNGQYLVTASSDKLLKVWSGSLGQQVESLGEKKLGVAHCIAFDVPSETVRVGYHDGTVRKFSVRTGAEMFAVKPHTSAVVGVAYHGKLHMSASEDSTVKVWSPASLPRCIQLIGHSAPVTCAAWEKTGLASASEDLVILVWPHDPATYTRLAKTTGKGKGSPTVTPLAKFHGHKAKISSIAFSTDGIRMVSTSHDCSVIVWDTLSQKHLQTLHACHKDWVTASAFSDTSPDWLVTGSSDFTLKLWDLKTGAVKVTFRGHMASITSVAFSQGCVASAAADGSVKVWTRKGVEITTLYCHRQRINQVVLDVPSRASASSSSWADMTEEDDPDEAKLDIKLENISVITASDDGTVGVWKPFIPNEITSLVGHSDQVLSVATTANNHILSSSLDGSVRLWAPRLTAGTQTGQLSVEGGHTGPVSACSFAPGGGCAISTGRDGCFIVWVIRRAKEEGGELRLERLHMVKASEKALSAACFISFNTKTTAATALIGKDDGYISTYKFTSSEYPALESTHNCVMEEQPVSKLALTPNGKHIVASFWDNNVVALDSTGNHKVTARMDEHWDWVMDVATANESKTTVVYSVSLDLTLRRWVLPAKQAKGSASRLPVTGTSSSYLIPAKRAKGLLREQPATRGSSSYPTWLLGVADLESHVAISDSTGSVSLWNKETKGVELRKKLHQAAINVLTTISGLLVTGSDDSTIKLWRVTRAPLGLKQLGLFHSQSCVTAIATVPRATKNDPQLLLVGDSIGHVTLLQWHQ